jgi:hypothetical protein
VATIGWVVWGVYFAVWETWTSLVEMEMLTDHLRPVFHAMPVIWFLGLGLWVWMGIHFLAPSLEGWLARAAGGA